MIEVVNRQRGKRIAAAPWVGRAQTMLHALGKPNASVTIAFVSDRKIRDLNRQFRGIDKSTDVLSFPSDGPEDLGDIAISVQTASRQARENGLTLNKEIAELILHGLLHLLGFDHETDNGEMNRLELKMRKRLEI